MGTGQQFAKKLGTVGCILVLAAAVLATVLMFSARGGAVEGYTAPRSAEYYETHSEELLEELRTGLLPRLGGENVTAALDNGRVLITAPADTLPGIRLSVTYYYGDDLVVFAEK